MSLLDKLLAADLKNINEKETTFFEVKRLSNKLGFKFDLKLQALSPKRYAEVQKQVVNVNKKGETEVNLFELQCLALIDGVIEPSLKDKNLLEKFEVVTPKELINKLFLSGEVVDIYNEINNLSGYEKDNDINVDEEIKN